MKAPHHTLRYTFDQDWLTGGIPMVPMVIGLFAISQAFVLLETKAAPNVPKDLSSVGRFTGLFEVFKYRATVIRSSLLGVVMGLLPGVGEFGAQFLSYSLARRFSKKARGIRQGLSRRACGVRGVDQRLHLHRACAASGAGNSG